MIRLATQLPKTEFALAFSAGADSVAALSFLLNGRRRFELVFIHHGTESSDKAQAAAERISSYVGIPLHTIRPAASKQPRQSLEEYWRTIRYSVLDNYKIPVILGHHLDDAVETYLFNSINGSCRTMPVFRNKNVCRPFLRSKRVDLHRFAQDKFPDLFAMHDHDQSNDDHTFARNRIRHMIMPQALSINPGLYKVVSRLIQTEPHNAS